MLSQVAKRLTFKEREREREMAEIKGLPPMIMIAAAVMCHQIEQFSVDFWLQCMSDSMAIGNQIDTFLGRKRNDTQNYFQCKSPIRVRTSREYTTGL